jgi:acyl-CoA thioester hydrolase
LTERPPLRPREAYAWFRTISTRWDDNDVYGHVNNVVHYTWFDAAVNAKLVETGLLDFRAGPIIGLVVESGCRYAAPLAFPQAIEAGVRVAHLGNSSVRYEIGLFAEGKGQAAAEGFFTHVYVDRDSRRPVALPEEWRSVLKTLSVHRG